jgi:hypothetical protein
MKTRGIHATGKRAGASGPANATWSHPYVGPPISSGWYYTATAFLSPYGSATDRVSVPFPRTPQPPDRISCRMTQHQRSHAGFLPRLLNPTVRASGTSTAQA